MLSKKYFEGQENITEGNRKGNDLILAELLNQKKSVFISAEQTGTGADQNIAHDLVDEAGNAVVPSAVFASITDDNNAAFAIVEGTHTSSNIVMNVTLNAKYKVLAIY